MIERAEFNLNALIGDYKDNTEIWMGGFTGREGSAESGVAYGREVLSDSEIGVVFEDSDLNQLGIELEHRGDVYNIRMSRGGYLEVYEPNDLGAMGYVRLLNEVIENYVR
ncbi:hypothetical protein AMS69_15720 [Haloarcula rubripromontorii]|uniref:Uncharacterized protein n=2 Tax=Haloarcula rubripromontorii TaxID=1705562 RepID=A0A0N0BN55_9EURY|nr:hypothetical protein AMS69_15720 [Haloarcula rubripromontorii]